MTRLQPFFANAEAFDLFVLFCFAVLFGFVLVAAFLHAAWEILRRMHDSESEGR